LEPWYVTEVGISGDFKLVSAIVSGLPTSEDLENSNIESLKSPPIPDNKDVDLLIGIFSTANNLSVGWQFEGHGCNMTLCAKER